MNSLNPLVAVLIVLFSLLADACLVYSRIWLAEWSTATSVTHQQRDTYLGVYGGFGFAQALCVLLASFFLAFGAYGASRHLHRALLVNIMHSPMSFFETTPLGRIVNRFSKDVYVIDDIVPRVFGTFLKTFMNVVSTLAAISFATQYFLIVLVPLGIIYILIQVSCAVNHKRNLSNNSYQEGAKSYGNDFIYVLPGWTHVTHWMNC